MTFNLSEKHIEVRDIARKFSVDEIQPRLAMMDELDQYPAALRKAMTEYGLWGLALPAEYGGAGKGYLAYVVALEEMAKEGMAAAGTLAVHTLCMETVYRYGTEEQKRQYLPALASGQDIGSFSFTETTTGSNPGAMEVELSRAGSGYVLNGTKTFSSNSPHDGVTTVFARDAEKGGALSVVVIRKGCEGFMLHEPITKMGMYGFETAAYSMNNIAISPEQILGGESGRRKGFSILLDVIAVGRMAIAAQALGAAERAFEEACKYAAVRVQHGKPINNYQAIQVLIANMATEIEAARGVVYKAAAMRDENKNISSEGAQAKLFATQAAKRVVDMSLSIHGAYGYTKEHVVERLYREVKLCELYEGTHEMLQVLIAQDYI